MSRRRPCPQGGVPEWVRRVPPGYGELHARTVWFGTRETRLSSLVSKDRSYKPMVKSSGGQRESEGAIVVTIGVQNNAPGAKGPHFGRACVRSERQDMAAMRPNHPGGCKPVDSSVSEMVQHGHLPALVVQELRRRQAMGSGQAAAGSPAAVCH